MTPDHIHDERRHAPALPPWHGNTAGPTAQWQHHLDELDLIRHLYTNRWTITDIARYLGRDRATIVRVLDEQ